MSVKTKNNEHKNINDEISATTTYTIDGNSFVVNIQNTILRNIRYYLVKITDKKQLI